MDYYLQFESEAAANAVLFTQEPTEWDNTDPENPVATAWEPRPNYRNIDTIGVIYKPTGETLQGEDGEYPEMAPIEGWHVNVRLADGEDAEALEPFVVQPSTPVRVWG
jgi:hypothetical protein